MLEPSRPAAPDVPTGFQVIHANRLEDLRALVVEVLRRYPLAPLAQEVFLVHSNGIAQWLKLALARDQDDPQLPGLGIAAAMDFLLPSRFLWQVYRAVLGSDAVATRSFYDKDQLTWRLFRLLPVLKDEPVFAPLGRFLAGAEPERRRFQLAERVADLFDQYQVYRADWLELWRQGRDEILVRGQQVRELEDDQRWQPELWRRLMADIADQAEFSAGLDVSRADVHTRFLAAAEPLTPATRPAGVPARLVVFGVSSLPQQTLEVLSRLGQCSQVLLCIHNPCQFYWADIIEDRELLRARHHRGQLRQGMPAELDDHNLHLHAHPLLAAWGKQGRDYIRLLDEYDDQTGYRQWFDRIDLFESPIDSAGNTLLAQLQDDIFQLRPVHEANRSVTPEQAQDGSIVFHCAHSPQREVEVLHDQLLAAFSADPDLTPQDVLVMVPDIDAYAPHIQAVFGQLPQDDDRFVPFTISDQGQRHQLPALIALEQLLSLPEARLGVSDILDLLDVPALRHRFGLQESDLPQLHAWIRGANIRWGLDGDQRQALDLPAGMDHNTWSFGLRRMLLGYAVGDGEAWQGIEPYGEVGGLESRLAGQLDALLAQLDGLWHALAEAHTPSAWAHLLHDLRSRFFEDLEEEDALVFSRLDQVVEDWVTACDDAGLTETPLPLAIVREVWLGGLEQGGLSQRFLAGKVNFATLMPMRAIPFRHICLLGMNDGDYPRSQPPMDFDLMAEDYRPGDRSRREDDRYLFLEAMLSARERLYLSWVGRSVNDNSERPPSVLLAQLRDHLDAIRVLQDDEGHPLDGPGLSARLTTEHPLQPFSRRYFPAGDNDDAGLFTFAREWHQAHGEDQQAQAIDEVPPGLPPGLLDDPIDLATLGRFLKAPVDGFFRHRLGVNFSELAEAPPDEEPFVLDGLGNWALSNELIQQVVAEPLPSDMAEPEVEAWLAANLEACIARQTARGDYPAGGVGELLRQRIQADLPALHRRYHQQLAGFPDDVELQPVAERYVLETPDGQVTVALEDWVQGLRAADAHSWARVALSSSNLTDRRKRYRWQHFLQPWVQHLSVNQLEDVMVTTCLLSKAGDINLMPMAASEARGYLQSLVRAWLASLQAPLPVAPMTAFAWLTGQQKSDDKALADARAAYEGSFGQSGEVERSPALQRAYPSFDALVADGQFQSWTETLYRPLWQAIKQPEGRT